MTAHSRLLVAFGVVAVLAAACSSATSPTPPTPASPAPSTIASSAPSTAGGPSVAPTSAQPEPSTAPSQKPTGAPVAWSKPTTVKGLEGCSSVVVAIDQAGTDHLAANCEAPGNAFEVRYATSTDGTTWTTSAFAPPAHRLEQDGQLAVDGSTLYLGWTRQAESDGSCGDDGLADVGVYVRTRSLPNGTWSAPERIGSTGDRLQSLRVADGVVHATVTSDDGAKHWYERLAAGSLQRVAIAGAQGPVALRVGDDGVARIAYQVANGLRFGTVTGTGVATTSIPGTGQGFDPIFVLEPGNVADVLWNQGWSGGGCSEPGPGPADGTYFSTNAGGSWTTTKLSTVVGASALTTDPASGDLIAVVDDSQTGATYRSADRTHWAKAPLGTKLSSAVLRVNPISGAQLLAYVVDPTKTGKFLVRVQSKG